MEKLLDGSFGVRTQNSLIIGYTIQVKIVQELVIFFGVLKNVYKISDLTSPRSVHTSIVSCDVGV